jgi:cell division control protein 6
MDLKDYIKKSLGVNTIFKNRDALFPYYMPQNIFHREKQIREITGKLISIFKSNTPINMFLYGGPGTGKTLTIKYILNEIESLNKENKLNVESIYINCGLTQTFHKIVSIIGRRFNIASDLEEISSYIKENNIKVILVLDEIDKIQNINSSIYALSRLSHEYKISFSIIGITNNVKFKSKLDPAVRSALCGYEIIFPPYNTEELRDILNDRVELAFFEDVVDYSVVPYISAYVGYQSGDARLAIQMLLRAGDIAEEEGAERVRIDHVEKAKDLAERDIVIEYLCVLPYTMRLVVYSLAKISENLLERNPYEDPYVSVADIYKTYYNLSLELGKRPVSERWVRQYLNELELYGYISSKYDGRVKKIKLNIPYKIVIKVIEDKIL